MFITVHCSNRTDRHIQGNGQPTARLRRLSIVKTLALFHLIITAVPLATYADPSTYHLQTDTEPRYQHHVDYELIDSYWEWNRIRRAFSDLIERYPEDYTYEQGAWYFFNVERCFRLDIYCFGNNPSTPYGYPVFANRTYEPEGSTGFMLDNTEAVVLLLQTPPAVRYYGITPYVQARMILDAIIPGKRRIVLGSFADTLNYLRINAVEKGSDTLTTFDGLAAVILTSNHAVAENLERRLIESGLSPNGINIIEIPTISESMPLYTGYNTEADEFTLIMRVGLPLVSEELDMWLDLEPLAVWRIGVPDTEFELFDASPYEERRTNYYEHSVVQNSLARMNSLITALKRRHSELTPRVFPKGHWVSTKGKACITDYELCNADNQDALYRQEDVDIPLYLTSDPENFWYLIGAAHRNTGKATYTNHSIYLKRLAAGVASITDENATGSAAYYAEPHAEGLEIGDYEDFYVFRVARDCDPEELDLGYCLEVPYPEPGQPIGVMDNDELFTFSRLYVETSSGVGPIPSEVIGSWMMVYE
ncbi:MAG: hypothetical protein ABW098_08000 [Candidatus Thiodiazotropha sp.]